jgi:hypothetical protein
MEGHRGYNLYLTHHRFVNLYRVRILETIPSNENAPAIPVQTQMINNDKLNKPIVKQATVSLVRFEHFRHFKQAMMKIKGHIQRVSHKNHKKTQVVEKHKSVSTFTGHELFDYHQSTVPLQFKCRDGHTSIKRGDFV